MAAPTPPDDPRKVLAARIRAARAFADVDQSVIGDALNLSVQTIKRLERGLRDVSDDEMTVIAQTCGVPLSFLVHGFPDQPVQRDRLAPITRDDAERLLSDMADSIAADVARRLQNDA